MSLLLTSRQSHHCEICKMYLRWLLELQIAPGINVATNIGLYTQHIAQLIYSSREV